MKNGYFQVVHSDGGTSLKLVPPVSGGEAISVNEVMEYLTMQNVMYDVPSLSKAVVEANTVGAQPVTVLLNKDDCPPIQETCKLIVSPDRMKAIARFYAASDRGKSMSPSEVKKDLAYKNISYGIKGDSIDAFFANPEYCKDVVVAEGLPPRHGEDARIEYYFQTDLHARPTLNEDGSVDFFNLNTINHCHAGDVLARLFPEDIGEFGCTIYNEKVKPRDVRRTTLKYGHNIHLSEDRKVLTAEVDGHVTLVEDKVFVSNILTVENVDNSTGNIEYEGSVQINGNVCTNFSVHAKGNIEVKGVVEGAHLEADGDITIARGINGMGRGTLKAGGNIIVKFMENTKASAGGYVSAESMLHSEVMAGTEILVTGRKGFITGGRVCASSLIEVKTLGSPMGADTIVEVGANPGIKMRIQELQKSIAECTKEIKTIQPVLTATSQKLAQGAKLHPDQIKYVQSLAIANKQKTEQLKAYMEEMDALQDTLSECAAAQIVVTGEVFAGTKICIADVSMVVQDSFKYCKFVKSQGDVKMTSL